MKIRMLSSQPASPDGLSVVLFQAGQKYDLPANLALTFIAMQVAEEDKDLGQAPEIKQEWPWGIEGTATHYTTPAVVDEPVKKTVKKRKRK